MPNNSRSYVNKKLKVLLGLDELWQLWVIAIVYIVL